MVSKRAIDRAGAFFAKNIGKSEDEIVTSDNSLDELIDSEELFDEYRKSHLEPLTQTTLELQNWLAGYGESYYIAQRLKRKPQIIRKLTRFSTRLTQLQDIGGIRIIVEKDLDVNRLLSFISSKVKAQDNFLIKKITDYREKGRDDTGYRSLHIIIQRSGFKLELQVRSSIQHYWAESIERTSVVYGYHLKEKEGDPAVIKYFKHLSDAFCEIEAGGEPSAQTKIDIDILKKDCEKIIQDSDRNKVFQSYVNEDVIKTLSEKESSGKRAINNWIIVFDWNTGAFISWDVVDRKFDSAFQKYVENERNFSAQDGYEVVMLGSSEIATVRKTHSHYFGIDSYDNILEGIDQSILGFSKRMDIDVGARQILLSMHRKRYWGRNHAMGRDVLKNHLCKNVIAFDSSFNTLIERDLVLSDAASAPVYLNIKKKAEIEQYI